MTTAKTNSYSFIKGWKQLPKHEMKDVRDEVCAALGVSIVTFYARLKGQPEPKISEAKAIEAIFANKGITDIWGD